MGSVYFVTNRVCRCSCALGVRVYYAVDVGLLRLLGPVKFGCFDRFEG